MSPHATCFVLFEVGPAEYGALAMPASGHASQHKGLQCSPQVLTQNCQESTKDLTERLMMSAYLTMGGLGEQGDDHCALLYDNLMLD